MIAHLLPFTHVHCAQRSQRLYPDFGAEPRSRQSQNR